MKSKTVRVVAAIIVDNGRVFATQRGYGAWKDWWEFPGGKVEEGEDAKAALRREIREELATEVEVGDLLACVEHDYPSSSADGNDGFHLSMMCFVCRVVKGRLSLLEHEDARWLGRGELDSVEWLPADAGIIPLLAERL